MNGDNNFSPTDIQNLILYSFLHHELTANKESSVPQEEESKSALCELDTVQERTKILSDLFKFLGSFGD